MKKLFITSILMMFAFVVNADAAVKIKNNTVAKMAAQEYGETEEELDEEAAIATLENDIRILDEEIAKCEKQKKGWVAATVIGGAGVLSTGVAAAVQGVKIKNQKDTISEQSKNIKELNKEKRELGK